MLYEPGTMLQMRHFVRHIVGHEMNFSDHVNTAHTMFTYN